jgi:hypothetical protein
MASLHGLRWPSLAVVGLALLTQAALAQNGATSGSTAPLSEPGDPPLHLARRIAGELEAGRIEEARIDAETGVKRYPEDSSLRRRRAQVRLCTALQFDAQFGQAVLDARFAPALSLGVELLRAGPPPGPRDAEDPDRAERSRTEWKALGEKLLTPEGLAAVSQFQKRAGKEIKESGILLQDSGGALQGVL